MPINVTGIDSKFKRKQLKLIKQQRGYDVMQKTDSDRAKERFKTEPYQLKYMRKYGENRTERETEEDIDGT